MPVEVRVAGFSLAYSLATAVFGGFTPAMSTLLIQYTGDKASPGYWMSFAALCALCATLFSIAVRPVACNRRRREPGDFDEKTIQPCRPPPGGRPEHCRSG